MPQNQTLSLETITKAKYSENKRFFISLFLLFSYWQSPHNSIWVMLCWQRMLTGKQWQHQSSSVPTCRSENPLMLPGSPCTLHGLNNLNTAQGRSVPPRKLLQRSVCWNWVPPFPRHPLVKHGLTAQLSLGMQSSQVIPLQTIASLSCHTWSCWCPPLLVHQHTQKGGGNRSELLPPQPQGILPTTAGKGPWQPQTGQDTPASILEWGHTSGWVCVKQS